MPFNDTVMDHVLRPRNEGPLANSNCMGCVGIPGEGRYIKIYLIVEEGHIKRASYECNGCPASIASASLVCQLVMGKPTGFAYILEPKDVLVMLQGLPEGKQDLPQVAVEALRLAVRHED